MRNADPKSNRSPGALSDVFIDAAVDAINQTGETVKNPLFSVPLKCDTVQARLVRYKSRDRRINHPVAFLSYMALNCRSRSIIGVTLNRLRETRPAPCPRIRAGSRKPCIGPSTSVTQSFRGVP